MVARFRVQSRSSETAPASVLLLPIPVSGGYDMLNPTSPSGSIALFVERQDALDRFGLGAEFDVDFWPVATEEMPE